jgi:hypothetical protein
MSSTSLGSEYSDEELDFLRAIDAYKRINGRPYPTWPEVLAVAKSLGYRKVSIKPAEDTSSFDA